MAQSTQLPAKPITLTILPINGGKHPSPTEINNQSVITQTTPMNQVNIPNFNHTLVTPIVVHEQRPKIVVKQLTAEEREIRRAAQQKERTVRYNEKIKEYKKIGLLKTEKEKIIKVLQLCYPSLEEIDPIELETKLNLFIQSFGLRL